MRFLCDEMLKGLGRWLRAAGYDTAIAAGGLADRDLVRGARAEGRILLTRDRRLAETAGREARVVWLGGDGIDATARALKETLEVNWQYAPFTRCLLDNTPLVAAPPARIAEVPAAARAAGGPFTLCPLCRRLYWPGGHVRRMRARLAAWQEASRSVL
ncbi:MAG TPA: DUF5615 family PIN-like protein [Stellaceae bacterium]|nr:DUF5615 family PIN-like protein [Stellaceae bacterium]